MTITVRRPFGQSKPPVVIAGGGIAGPAVGIALVRAGIDAVVCEASPLPRDDAGVFLNLAPNGVAALRALGVGHIVDGLGFQNDRLVLQNEAGRVLADVAVGGVTVMRGALSRAVRQEAERLGVRFVYGAALESVEESAGRIVARLANGTSIDGSCLIGADGIHSRTRSFVVPHALPPTYTGIINLGGIVHTDLPTTGTAMRMVFGRRAFFGYAVRPSGETYWFSNVVQPDEPSRGMVAPIDADVIREQLLAVHRDDPPEVTRILKSLVGQIGAYPDYDLPPLACWQRGRVCVIGDAAHAMGPHIGQGSSLALEDAFVIAKCLRDLSDPADAFRTFEQLRRGRVDPVVRQSRRTAKQKAPTGWVARKLRDLILPVFVRKSAQAAQQLYRYPLVWDEPAA
jgi:2-polyprenyl-6-methoxyphenol hydroxylase-like FAD-dependent oxidoreductase